MTSYRPNEEFMRLDQRKRKEPADNVAEQEQHKRKIFKCTLPVASIQTEVKEVMGSINLEQNVPSGIDNLSRQTFAGTLMEQFISHGSSTDTDGILELAAGDVCTSDFDDSTPWGIELVLETKWIRMKRAAMVEFESKICKMKQDFKTEKESMEGKFMRDISNLEAQKSMFRELIYQKEKTVTEKNIAISNLSRILQKQQDQIHISKAFYLWRMSFLHHKHEEFRFNIIAQKHYERKTKQKVLLLWHLLAKQRWRAKVQQFYETRSTQFCQDFARKEEATTEKLKKELTITQEEIRNLTEKMNVQKDLMKRSLLRGVSALNAETIKLFTSTESDTLGGADGEQFAIQQTGVQTEARSTVPIPAPRTFIPGKKDIQTASECNEKVPKSLLPSGRMKTGIRTSKLTQVSGCFVERHLPFKKHSDRSPGTPTKRRYRQERLKM